MLKLPHNFPAFPPPLLPTPGGTSGPAASTPGPRPQLCSHPCGVHMAPPRAPMPPRELTAQGLQGSGCRQDCGPCAVKEVILLKFCTRASGRKAVRMTLNHHITWLLSFVLQEDHPKSLLFRVMRRSSRATFCHFEAAASSPGLLQGQQSHCACHVSASMGQTREKSMKC